ncbi:hypothetical protein JG677_03035 [Campylobacter sp. TTU-622]|uniref:hypothetical protein n=1 Tax=Campylobacter sp. TTU-622 TaxID=2800583 RepID=UPI001902F835|nr:hypothetical protein [Campylobacter sp. TTU-622]MBK1973027.1 hypothetical protein [Campylobacter sp. TTU-622]
MTLTQEIKDFKKSLLKGDLVIILTKVSKNGLKRKFKVFYKKDDKLFPIPKELAEKVSEKKLDQYDLDITIMGSGMDMSIALWIRISKILNCYDECYNNYKNSKKEFNSFYSNWNQFIQIEPLMKKIFKL